MYLTVLNKDCLIHLDDNAAFVLSQGIWIISNEALTEGVWSFEGHLNDCTCYQSPDKSFCLDNARNSSTVFTPMFFPDLSLTDIDLLCSSLSPTISIKGTLCTCAFRIFEFILSLPASIFIRSPLSCKIVRNS